MRCINIIYITHLLPDLVSTQLGYKDKTKAVHQLLTDLSSKKNVKILAIKPVFNNFRNKDFQITDINENYRLICINVIRIKYFEFYFLLNSQNIIKYILNYFEPDIIISHMYKSYIWANILSNNLRIPHIINLHNSDIILMKYFYYRFYLGKTIKKASLIGCRSKIIQKKVSTYLKIIESKLFYLPSGIPINTIVSKNDFLNKYTKLFLSKKLNIVSVARLIKLKNIDKVLFALSKLDGNIEWNYIIIGDGPELKNLIKLSVELKLLDRVTFVGWKNSEEINKILMISNIFILPSFPETFGIAYLEAMAKGNIVIATKNTGIDGVIINGINGFTVNHLNAINEINTILMKIIKYNFEDLQQIFDRSFATINEMNNNIIIDNYYSQIMKTLI